MMAAAQADHHEDRAEHMQSTNTTSLQLRSAALGLLLT